MTFRIFDIDYQNEKKEELNSLLHKYQSSAIGLEDLKIELKNKGMCNKCTLDESELKLKTNSMLYVANHSDKPKKDLIKLRSCDYNLGKFLNE